MNAGTVYIMHRFLENLMLENVIFNYSSGVNGVRALNTLAFTCNSLIPTEKASSSQLQDQSKIKLVCPFFEG